LIYLLDANVLIAANRSYYAIERVPEFWEWVQHIAAGGRLKMTVEIYEEIQDDEHGLGEWARKDDVRSALILDEAADRRRVQHVVENGYAADLTDDELEKLGRDPFLIAYALVDPANRTVVTAEQSKPSAQRSNRRVPDVCKTLRVRWCDTFGMTTALNFTTDWKRRAV
jgi:hypothetical protein